MAPGGGAVSSGDASASIWTAVATWFGAGRFPVAPGTAGTLGALPLYLLIRGSSWPCYLTVLGGLFTLGVWTSQRVATQTGDDDPPSVVIDEVVGVLLALGLVRKRGPMAEIGSVLLFRLLDITKPGPIGRAEHAQPAGVGIMLDDLVAGLGAGLLARLLSGH
jgi:phosphatidylglycerophosphatase A